MGEHGSSATVPLGRYLWERIHQVGVNHIFGVPGDFNLTLLDHIYDVDGLEWVGNTNELNAAYAADGYARVKNAAGCVVTTHGVGELSALNAIAGAMTEQVKVIHVVGQTSLGMQQNRLMIHHSIGFSPDHQVFNKASRDFRVAAAELQSEHGAADEIDRVLRECFQKSGPVYVFFPIDLVDKPIPADRLETPLDLEPEADADAVEKAATKILESISSRSSPAVFVDCLVQRHNAIAETKALVDALALPVYTSNMGKGIIDETHTYYAGLYNGEPSGPGVAAAFRKHDCILILGSLPSDTNSGAFTRRISKEIELSVNTHDVEIQGGEKYTRAPIRAVIQRLVALVSAHKIPTVSNPRQDYPTRAPEPDADSPAIRQSWVWHRLAAWLQPGDVVFGETGTAAFGIPDAKFPADITWITQTYYGSIGYATPAALGADLALADRAKSGHSSSRRGRTVLLTGDGSLMLTLQEVGNMVKQGLQPVIFVINNAGYTIERVIHGARQSYNDIIEFKYERLLEFAGAKGKEGYHRAASRAELEAVLALDTVVSPAGVQVIEVVMDAMDVPWRLAKQIALRGPEAVREMKEAGFRVEDLEDTKGFWN